jgi:hypothetical protein
VIGEERKVGLPFTVASAIAPYAVVTVNTAANRSVFPVATNNVRPLGLNGPATGLQGEAITIYDDGAVVEAIAGASLGAGAELVVASTNGTIAPGAGASGVTRWAVGYSIEAAAAGEKFSLYVRPRQISNVQ